MPPERISLTAPWDDCQRWCVFCETAEQTVWCINKESCICCGEIYKCRISLVGDVIIQARLARGEDEAFRTSLLLPLRKWIRLDCYIQDSEVQNSACSPGCQNWGGEGPQATDFSLFVWVCSTALALRGLSSCWNSCKILKDVCFPAGKCSPRCNLEPFAAECFLCACIFLSSCIITCASYSQVQLHATWDSDIHRYVYMYDTGLFVFLHLFLTKFCGNATKHMSGINNAVIRSSVVLNITKASRQRPLRWHWWVLCDRRKQVRTRHPWILWSHQVLSVRN